MINGRVQKRGGREVFVVLSFVRFTRFTIFVRFIFLTCSLSALIPLQNHKDHRKNDWFNFVQEAVRLQQDRKIWVSESKVSHTEGWQYTRMVSKNAR